jgi:hypothetical protein
MIHDIMLLWPDINLDVDFAIVETKSDTIIVNLTIADLDISDYKIRCELTDGGREIRLANLAAGGSDSEIKSIDAESGMSAVQIKVPAKATEDFVDYATLEVEIEDTDGNVFTVLQQRVRLSDEQIDWTNPA